MQQRFIRDALSLEFLKFWGDYYGFVPFAGLFAGREFLKAAETDHGQQTFDIDNDQWSWGFSFGWDIRPVRSPAVLLRTNLRYTPFLSLTTPDNKRLRFDHSEVDFIQVVIYPQRLFH